jgi:hypothetical protein
MRQGVRYKRDPLSGANRKMPKESSFGIDQ